VDLSTGTAPLVGNIGLFGQTPDIHFDAAGNLFAAKGGGFGINNLISIDKSTGLGTVIGPIGFQSVSGLASLPEVLQGKQISVIPGAINFGQVDINGSGVTRTVTVLSIGTEDLTVSDISDPGTPFSLSNLPTLPVVIPPGNSETFDVTFAPTNTMTFNATITITSDDPGDITKNVPLNGEGVVIALADTGVLYGSTGNSDGGRLLTIDPSTGEGTLIGSTGLGAVPGLAINSSGEIYGTEPTGGDFYRIDAATGTAVFTASTGLSRLEAIAFDTSDVLYGISSSNGNLYTIDPTTGNTNLIGFSGFFKGLSFDPTDGSLWASERFNDELYTIDPSTGSATLVGKIGAGGSPDLHFDVAGNLYATQGGGFGVNNLISIDKSTGAGTVIGEIGFSSVSGLAFHPAPIEGRHIRVIPDSINYLVEVGDTTSKTVTMSNIGTDDLTVSSITDPGAPFSLSGLPSLPVVIPSGSSETFEVAFSPTDTVMFNASIAITSDDPDDPTKNVALNGEGVVIAPADSGVLYGSTGNSDGGRLLTIDPSTGVGTLIGSTGLGAVPGLAINSNGVIYGTDDTSGDFYKIDALTGTAVFASSTGLSRLEAIAFDTSDVLYGVSSNNGNLYTIDPATGSTNLIGFSGFFKGLAFDPTDGTLWGSQFDGIHTVDPSNGSATLVGNIGVGGFQTPDIHFDVAGNLFAAQGGGFNTNNLILIDKSTGAGTVIGEIGFSSVSGLAFHPAPIEGRHIRVIPDSINYLVEVGDTTSKTVTMSNIGTDDLTVSSITDPGAPFSLNGLPSLPVVIPSGNSETFEVTLATTDSGMFNATITITSDDPDDATEIVALTGKSLFLVDADPGVLYGSTGNSDGGRLLTIDPSTGEGTLIGSTGLGAVPGLAINSNGEIYGTDDTGGDFYRIDAATGTAVFVSSTGLSRFEAIAFDSSDVLYGVSSFNANLYTIDPATGNTNLIGPSRFFKGLAFDPTDGTLWGSQGDDIYTLDPSNGTATLVGSTGLFGQTPDIHFDAAGNLFAAKGGGFNVNNLISIDKASGAGTVIGPIGFQSVSGLATRFAVNRPPSSFALLSPADDVTIDSLTVTFIWEKSVDPDLDEINYTLHLSGAGKDTAISGISDTSTSFDGSNYFMSDTLYTWLVKATDGEDTTASTTQNTFRTPIIVGVDVSEQIPNKFFLNQNYPNPFNPATTIKYNLPFSSKIKIIIYDIPKYFIRYFNEAYDFYIKGLSQPAIDLLQLYSWPGNIRELKNVIERAVLTNTSGWIEPEDLLPDGAPEKIGGEEKADDLTEWAENGFHKFHVPDEGISLEKVEHDLILSALEKADGNMSLTARPLKITRGKLRYRLEKLGITSRTIYQLKAKSY